jgi:hypothetical protein
VKIQDTGHRTEMRVEPDQLGERQERASEHEVVAATQFGVMFLREPRHGSAHPPLPVTRRHRQDSALHIETVAEPVGQRSQESAVGSAAEGFDEQDVHGCGARGDEFGLPPEENQYAKPLQEGDLSIV